MQAWGHERNAGIFLTGKEGEKTSNVTTFCPLVPSSWHLAVQGTNSLIDWIILLCKEAWSNKGDLPGHMGPWKTVEDVWLILMELRMKQAPVFENHDQATFTEGMKTKILESGPSTWCGTLISMWTQLWNKMFMMLSNPLLILGKLSNPRNGYGLWERPEIERETQKYNKTTPNHI